ncbi:MAG: pseudouridine synthase [Maribacter sp.]|nr:pseudouridine synthase [Maribacter sp.]
MRSNNPKEARSKRFLTELHDFPEGIMPIGRLDENSEGLLLLTTEGKRSDTINRSGIEKEYYAQLDGEITDDALRQLTMGVEIGFHGKKYAAKAVAIKKLPMPPNFPEADRKIRLGRHRPTSWIGMTLTEGKFRQVRKMTAAVGFPTLRLVRIRIGLITLDGLQPGNVQMLHALNL